MVDRAYVDKFSRALHALCVSEGDVRARLKLAYPHLRRVFVESVPEPYHDELKSILGDMTAKGPSAEEFHDGMPMRDALENTLFGMRNVTAKKLAERIYRMTTGALGF